MKAAIFFVFMLSLSLLPMSYAISGGGDAGIMPGNILYPFDLFFERMQILFAFNAEKKVQVLISIAQERTSEIEALDSDNRDRYSAILVHQRDLYAEQAKKIISDSDLDDSVSADILIPIDEIHSEDIIDDGSGDSLVEEIPDENIEVNNISQPIESEMYTAPIPKLSDLQETACQAAEKGNTCHTRLADLGFVTKEECCVSLGVCCS